MPKIDIGTPYRLRILIVAGIALPALLLSLAGCGIGSEVAPQAVSNVVLSGRVHGGQQPVTGSNVALFTTSSTGYGGTVTPIATTTTDGSGDFVISSSYTCPAGQQAYIVATGGNPGAAPGTDNSALFLVAALGPCSTLQPFAVDINEVTTVAAAYALSGFAPAGGAGMTESAVIAGTAMPGVTTSSTNTQGLSDAFLNAANIVNFNTGLAYTATPATGSTGVVPQSVIHALADILQPCVNSSAPTGSSSSCPALFAAATPPAGSGIAAPVNSFQAALDIARFPGSNVATLFGLMSGTPAFPTTLSAAPNDWTIGITYTNSLLVSGAGLGIDASDNIYVTGKGYLMSLGPQGQSPSANLAPTVPGADTLRNIAFDRSGNLFSTDDTQGGMWEYQPATTTATYRTFNAAPANDPNPNSYGIAVDKQGDVFTSSYSKAKCATPATECMLVEYPATATTAPTSYPAYTPFVSFPISGGGTSYSDSQPSGGIGGARSIAFDVNTGNVWATDIDDDLTNFFNLTPGTSGVATATAAPVLITGIGTEPGSPANDQYGSIGVAVDSSSRAWFVVTGGTAAPAVAAGLYPVSSTGVLGTGVTGGGLNTPAMIAVDGRDNLFVANASGVTTGGSVVEYSPALGTFLSPSGGFIPSSTGSLYEPVYISVDRSGAVWTLSSGSGATGKATNVIQILGVAAPTDPILANGNYGVKP